MQIIFKFDTPFGSFCDALNLPDDHGLTDEQLEVMKQERLTNWLAVVNPVIDPTAVDTPPAEEV
jgi:hypothetical protein